MKKITRRSFLAAMAAVSATGVLTACGGSGNAASSAAASESASVSSEAVSSAASADETGTHTVIDHGGKMAVASRPGGPPPRLLARQTAAVQGPLPVPAFW